MGPFKHTVDDGLDVRKAAFECMYTLLESCLDRLDIYEYLNHVEDGLKDHYDIRVCAGPYPGVVTAGRCWVLWEPGLELSRCVTTHGLSLPRRSPRSAVRWPRS